jgi:hypothetical protein
MEIKNAALNAIVDSIDLKKLVSSLIDNVVEEALKKVVADSENTFDDVAFAALWPSLEKQIHKLIEEHLDLKKILIKE